MHRLRKRRPQLDGDSRPPICDAPKRRSLEDAPRLPPTQHPSSFASAASSCKGWTLPSSRVAKSRGIIELHVDPRLPAGVS